jgi:DNA-binding transcriptional LysR family regulator
MSVRQMEYFLAVVEEGSFSRAASRLNVTQPALSQQVKALEAELGAPLLERLGRGVRITAAGRAYLPHVNVTLAAYQRGRRAVGGVASGLAGELEIGTVISVGVGVIMKPLLRWHIDFPDVAVRLSEFSHRRALESFVADGRADIGIGPTPVGWRGPAVPLGHERFVLIISRDDPAVRAIRPYTGKPPRAASKSIGRLPILSLRDRQWVLFERTNGLSEFVEGHLSAAGLPPPLASVRTSQFMAAATLAGGGMGPTLIPANVASADIAGVICEPDPPLLRSLSAYSRNSLDGFAGQFISLLRQHCTMLEQPKTKRARENRDLA